MTVRQQWAVVAAIVAALAGALAIGVYTLGDQIFPVVVGSKAPPFRAVTLDTPPQEKTLDDFRGEVVLLNVWATWCAPCVVEMPSIEALHRRFKDRGLHVVAVSVDDGSAADEIREFRDEHGLTFEILHDPEGRIRRDYQTTGIPETFIIGRDGVIRRKVIAADDWDSPANRALVASLLGVPVPGADGGPAAPGADSPIARPVPASGGAR